MKENYRVESSDGDGKSRFKGVKKRVFVSVGCGTFFGSVGGGPACPARAGKRKKRRESWRPAPEKKKDNEKRPRPGICARGQAEKISPKSGADNSSDLSKKTRNKIFTKYDPPVTEPGIQYLPASNLRNELTLTKPLAAFAPRLTTTRPNRTEKTLD